MCSMEGPLQAKTPILNLPSPHRQALPDYIHGRPAFRDRPDGGADAGHRQPQIGAQFAECRGPGSGRWPPQWPWRVGRVAAFEYPRPDEDPSTPAASSTRVLPASRCSAAKLTPAGGPASGLLHQFKGCPRFLANTISSSSVVLQRADAPSTVRAWRTASTTSPVPASPCTDHGRTFSDAAQGLSQVPAAADTALQRCLWM